MWDEVIHKINDMIEDDDREVVKASLRELREWCYNQRDVF